MNWVPQNDSRRFLLCCLLLAGLAGGGSGLFAAPKSGSEPVDFNEEVRPILSDKCFTCHGPDEATRKTKLRFDTQEGMFVELVNGGQAIVPGEPEESEAYKRITSEDPIKRMPPGYLGHEKLKDEQIETIRRWIEEGANFESHWAFRKPVRPESLDVENEEWAKNAIDYFVRDRLEKEGLEPSPEADRRKLIRRVTLDLTGLPPTLDQIGRFLNDKRPGAYERLVDRLLASPAYGERMAFRWLDAARYADTNGYQSDGVRSMWRWRDWVIGAFNENMPFDQFTIEQIAGDLLPGATRDQVIATGFNRNHRTNAEGGVIEEEFRTEYVADRVETTSTVWLGVTMGCARCHDHKYDPFSQKDFYELFAYFNNVPERGLVYNFGNDDPQIKAPTRDQEARLAQLDRELARAKKHWESLQDKIAAKQSAWEEWVRQSGVPDWTPHKGLLAHFRLDGGLTPSGKSYEQRDEPEGSGKDEEAGEGEEQVPAPRVKEAADGALEFTEGKLGQAAKFDGKRYVDAGPGFEFNYMDPFTFSAWIYPTAPTGAILSKVDDFPKGTGHGLYLRDGKIFLYITVRWTDISMRLQTARPVKMNEWQHVAVTYDGERKAKGVHIYVNGKEWKKDVLFDELSFPFSTKEPFRIGAGGGPENRFHGAIDEVRVYGRALPREEAIALSVVETVPEIATIPPAERTAAQKSKLRLAFLDQFAPADVREARRAYNGARRERTKFYESIPTVMVMKEMEEPRETHLLKRGAYDQPGERVYPDIPDVLGELPEEYPNNRLGLARWLVSRDNPLTARVTVNRFWQMLWGRGLVETAENFGSQGESPTHPKLLDWLAVEFMESGWDVKRLMKTMVMSAAYRQSSKAAPELLEQDPENNLLARGPRVRLSAEAIRDQALAAAGLLVERVGGPPVKPYQPPGLWKELTFSNVGYQRDSGSKLYRRSLYTFWRRTVGPPLMTNFDAAGRETCIVRTKRTNTPLQALNLMNDVTFLEAARKMAERMMKEGGASPEERIAYGFELAAARRPKADESRVLLDAYRKFLLSYEDNEAAAVQFLSEGESPRDESLDPVELTSYANVASLILNLDETITKE